MIYNQDYNSFVYIWRDRKTKRFHIGKYRGPTNDDGYISSSRWMMDEYFKRKGDFRRRILEYVWDVDGSQIKSAELKWLGMIKEEELALRYYNLRNDRVSYKKEVVAPTKRQITFAEMRELRLLHDQGLICFMDEKPSRGSIYLPLLKKPCEECGIVIETKLETRRFCSRECSGRSTARKRKSNGEVFGFTKGMRATNKGKPNPRGAKNGRKGALKLAIKATGRKRKYLPGGRWTWEYPLGK